MTPTETKTKPKAPTAKPAIVGQRVLRADAQRNRDAVIAAARKLFAEHGNDAQMDDIAAGRKVGVGTVYRHFPTKDDLLLALIEKRFEALSERAAQAVAEAARATPGRRSATTSSGRPSSSPATARYRRRWRPAPRRWRAPPRTPAWSTSATC